MQKHFFLFFVHAPFLRQPRTDRVSSYGLATARAEEARPTVGRGHKGRASPNAHRRFCIRSQEAKAIPNLRAQAPQAQLRSQAQVAAEVESSASGCPEALLHPRVKFFCVRVLFGPHGVALVQPLLQAGGRARTSVRQFAS